MPKLFKITALLLATIWFPATLHCGWEVFDCSDHEVECDQCCLPAEDCTDDACEIVEEASYLKPQSDNLISAPALTVVLCVMCTWGDPTAPETFAGLEAIGEFGPKNGRIHASSLRVAQTTVLRL
ncbi:MAG: hypothetical protein SynsKO_06590 [Synoicihabitans sp.]